MSTLCCPLGNFDPKAKLPVVFKLGEWTGDGMNLSATLNTPVTFSSSYIVLPVHTPSRKFSLNLIFPDMFCPKTLFPSFQRFPVIIFPP